MTLLEQAQAIVNQLKGVTSTLTIHNAMSELNKILVLQSAECMKAHKLVSDAISYQESEKVKLKQAVNTAKEVESNEELTKKIISNLHDDAKRQRQELNSERYSNGL